MIDAVRSIVLEAKEAVRCANAPQVCWAGLPPPGWLCKSAWGMPWLRSNPLSAIRLWC